MWDRTVPPGHVRPCPSGRSRGSERQRPTIYIILYINDDLLIIYQFLLHTEASWRGNRAPSTILDAKPVRTNSFRAHTNNVRDNTTPGQKRDTLRFTVDSSRVLVYIRMTSCMPNLTRRIFFHCALIHPDDLQSAASRVNDWTSKF